MPLDRAHVRRAARYAVPAFPIFMGVVGASMLLTPLSRLLETPAFRYANDWISIRLWGLAFAAIAAAMVAAMLTRRRPTYQHALGVVIVWMTIWAAVLIGSFFAGDSSPGAWIWPSMIACFAWCTLLDLEDRTGQDR